MSVQAISWVMDDERITKGGLRLVLMSIANHADRFGENSWPSIKTIAREANLSERAAQYSVGQLVKLGLIEVDQQGGGHVRMRNDRRPNRYRIIPLSAETLQLRGETHCTPSDSTRGARSSPGGEKSPVTGCKIDGHGVKPTAPKPSEPSKTSENREQPESNEGDPAAWADQDRLAKAFGLRWRPQTTERI